MNNTTNNYGGIGFFGLLAVALICLKLTNMITISWLWVLAPIWAPLAFVLLLMLIVWTSTYLLNKRNRR